MTILFKHVLFLKVLHSRDSSIGIAMGYGLDRRGSIPDSGKRFFSTPQHPGWLWGPPSLLYNGYWHSFPRSKGRDVKLTTQLDLEPGSRMVELYFHSPIHLNGVVYLFKVLYFVISIKQSNICMKMQVGEIQDECSHRLTASGHS
jgi:hypothetical protein